MRAGRVRFQIETVTFNILKNQDYHFEPNYGHGKRHLATVLATLMRLPFLLVQVPEFAGSLFQAARNRYSYQSFFGEILRAYWFLRVGPRWEVLFKVVFNRLKLEVEQLGSS
jgi:hypothetical protein